MQRIVALEFGLKRTGIALTDEMNIIASGLTTVDSRELMTYLKNLVETKNIGTIVLGEPKRLNLEDSHSSENVRLLKEALDKEFPLLTIALVDERFTSKMAMQTMHLGGLSKNRKQTKR